eukprot:2742372-Rhodomonas_salina.1
MRGKTPAVVQTVLPRQRLGFDLATSCAVSGADIRYALSCYAAAMRCPVLTSASCYAMSGTDVRYVLRDVLLYVLR